MIIQGTNNPIILQFDNPNDVPGENSDMSVVLSNQYEEFKRWGKADLDVDETGLIFSAPIDQEESMAWEPGQVQILVKWMDDDGNTMFARAQDVILPWTDKTVLSNDQPEPEPEPDDEEPDEEEPEE